MSVTLLCSSIYSIGWSAQPAKSLLKAPTPIVFEILNMPVKNRTLLAHKQGPGFIKDLRVIAQSSDMPMSLRWRALMLLTEIQPEEAMKDLLLATKSPDWYMRNAGLLGLQQTHPQKAADVAQRLVTDKALVVRSAAVDVLAQNMSPSVRNQLWQELFKRYNFRADKSLWIRPQIVKALSQMPAQDEKQIFGRLLQDSNREIQAWSIVGIEKLEKASAPKNLSIEAKSAFWKNKLKL